MQKLTEVLAMGGYGSFIWPAYALACAVMTGICVLSLRALRKAQASLRDLQTFTEADET